MNIRYAIKRFFRLDFGRMGRKIDEVAQKSGKARFLILCDMLWCGAVYGAGPNDYALFEFYRLTAAQRKTYITRGTNNALVKRYNDPAYCHIFDNKDEFNELFADFMERDWVSSDNLTREAFDAFIAGKEAVIYKPTAGTCGKGAEKFVLAETDPDTLYEHLVSLPSGVVEEVVKQDAAMAKIYPLSVNTVRLVTLLKDGVCTPVFAFWRIGNGGHYVDNLNSDGMAAMLDLKDGHITLPAADKDGKVYTHHPMTGEAIVGFTIPHWDAVLATADKASHRVPQVGYVGWDVVVTDKGGTLLLEGNCFPGHDILQLPAYTPDNIGLMDRVRDFL